MIYVPNAQNYKCVSIYNSETIRAYKETPVINGTSNYTDFFINSHYLENNGTQSWNQWATNLPVCLPNEQITNDFYYRNDLSDILIIFSVISFIGFVIPFKIITRFFKKLR